MIAAAVGLAITVSGHPIRQELVDRLNRNPHKTWTAANPTDNPMATLAEIQIQGMMGLHMPEAVKNKPLKVGRPDIADIPSSFDAREQWPSCKKPIRNQACGSCWAFGGAETLTDNLCVLGQSPPALSAQNLVSCDSVDHGCKGGTLLDAWSYIDKNGLVSHQCMPYVSGGAPGNETIPACPLPGCSGTGEMKAFKCPVKHTMLDSDEEIQAAVMTAGAVEGGFFVMEDFMNYKSGIYKYQEGRQLGGHAVKIIGWGHDTVAGFYWVVQNSWGASWGEQGYFRIVNWKADKESAIAIGGGFTCLQGPTPAPPGPAPTPSSCEDIVSYCNEYDHAKCAAKTYIVPVCKKTCGCCNDVLKPSYCGNETFSVIV